MYESYSISANNQDLNYDKFFTKGDVKHATGEDLFHSIFRLNLEGTKVK